MKEKVLERWYVGNINWFQGNSAIFYGLQYQVNDKITISAEYTSDLMKRESPYLDVKSPLNFGAAYQLNDFISLSAQYLHGRQMSITAQVNVNPDRPPLMGGKELAPVPMRLRGEGNPLLNISDDGVIRRVLAVDGFEIQNLSLPMTLSAF